MIYSYNDSDESRIYHLFIFPSYISVKKKKKIIKDSIQIYKEIYIISSNSPFYVSVALHSTAFDTDSYECTLVQYNQNFQPAKNILRITRKL